MTSDPDEPQHGIRLKWALVAVALFALLATALAAALLFGGTDTPRDSANSQTGTRGAGTDQAVASANDTGPVTVITDDPSCAAWKPINNTLATIGQGVWDERDRSIPSTAWTDKERAQFAAAGQIMRSAAAQTVGLAKLTPHRVMRELYEQFIAYARAYADSLPHYTPADNNLAATANSASSALDAICAAIADGAAAARGPLVAPPAQPSRPAPPGNPANPQRYLLNPSPVCAEWKTALEQFGAQTAEWQQIDPNIPHYQWNQQQKAANYAVAAVMNTFANQLEQLGRRSANAVLQDFAELSAQYRRAFVLALQTYEPSDNWLANAATYASTMVLGACEAATS